MNSETAEVQGLYGPFALSERLVQQLWIDQPWGRADLKLWHGERCRIHFVGDWNHSGGPDFRNGMIEIDGMMIKGDIEIHFYAEDWSRHGHHNNPEFDRTVLHVCMFPPKGLAVDCRTYSGKPLPLLILAPLMPQDLESILDNYQSNEQPAWQMALIDLQKKVGPETLSIALIQGARQRFDAKQKFAQWMIQREGWEKACHEWFLGQLGIPRNRAAMVSCAQRFPLSEMQHSKFDPVQAMASNSVRWQRSGLRPASQPLNRLRQYHRLVKARPEWPEIWQRKESIPAPGDPGFMALTKWRRKHGIMLFKQWIEREMLNSIWTGSRLDTLVVDVLLPLKQVEQPDIDYFPLWFHWWAGDWPDSYFETARELKFQSPQRRNGWFQGLFEWILNHRLDQSIPSSR